MKRKLTKAELNIRGFKNAVQITIKLAVVVLLMSFLYIGLDKLFKPSNVDTGVSFKSLPKNSQDIIVLGSSHAEYSFVPEFIYEDLGLYSYVLHSACQPLEVSYQMLKEAYKTQSPKVVVLEVYTALPHRINCLSDSSYVLPSYQMTGQERIDTLNYLSKEKALQYYNDFNINHNNWRTLSSFKELNNSNSKLDVSNISRTFGYKPLLPKLPTDEYWSPVTYENDIEVELDEKDIDTLNNILKLCKEHNSELFLYATPMDNYQIEDQSSLHKVWEWAKGNNVEYIDFIEESKTNGFLMKIHSDSWHACCNGAGLITGVLAKQLKKYDFNHIDNSDLNKIFVEEEFNRVKDYLSCEYNPLKYISRIKSYKGTKILRYAGYDQELDQNLVNELKSFGVGSDFRTDYGYIAVFKDNELIKSGYDSLEVDLDGHHFEINNSMVKMDGNIVDEEGPLSFTIFNNDYSESITKRIEYREGWLWEFGYSHYGK